MHLLHMSVVLYILNTLLGAVHGHAYLTDPPGRNSMWRFGFNAMINYSDNDQNCGGFLHQKYLGGKCGMCGDPYDQPAPRDNEAGGKYATGTISKYYTAGSTIDITVRITMNHLGFFEFRLCENNDVTKTITKKCLKHLLVNPETGETKRYFGDRTGDIVTRVKLPKNVTCSQCVLQWRYKTGNSWGTDDQGSCLGCGPQEEFYGCSDIAISSSGVTNEASTPKTSTLLTTSSTASTTKTTAAPTESTTDSNKTTTVPTESTTGTTTTTTVPTESTTDTTTTTTAHPKTKRSCVSIAVNAEDKWCNTNCNHDPSFCPPYLCSCN
ncbi:cell wall protein DAN4-like [Mizuhopecten yessoensis]|uniref:cell wall protein DAN4-like n=1 Tax=Mizuhopecten yessoensis TaxID=6573 RepID=UPI000B45C88E|nr:cell wall protein DAN4-like [Mizuhopecten yessoensis]